jgi:hypothetical protein
VQESEARKQYQRTLEAKIDFEVAYHNAWTPKAVADYREIVTEFNKARRQLFLVEPDERFHNSVWWQLRHQMSVEDRLKHCE